MVDLRQRRTLIDDGMGAFALGGRPSSLRDRVRAGKMHALTLAFIPQENPEKLLGDIDVITDVSQRAGSALPVEWVRHPRSRRGGRGAAQPARRISLSPVRYLMSSPMTRLAPRSCSPRSIAGRRPTRRACSCRKDSGLYETPVDLRGKTAAFADPISESGYLYPARDSGRSRPSRPERRPPRLL